MGSPVFTIAILPLNTHVPPSINCQSLVTLNVAFRFRLCRKWIAQLQENPRHFAINFFFFFFFFFFFAYFKAPCPWAVFTDKSGLAHYMAVTRGQCVVRNITLRKWQELGQKRE
uniref:Uncharacterized protein n=1 Tax=Trypanosoma vivax (strain Y486) TaxID=1055687 RepID=G0U139_TRYVY|nr:hypothetical protein, unlikely [Trypanosoma vivax Y486]